MYEIYSEMKRRCRFYRKKVLSLRSILYVLLIEECKWTEEALQNQLIEKAKKLPFAKDKDIIPVFLKYPPINKGESVRLG